MPFQLSIIQPSKNSIHPPESVSLSFTLTSSPGVDYIINYNLAETNNLFFQKPDGTTTKQVTDNGTMAGNVAVFNDDFLVVSNGPKAFNNFIIKVTARTGQNGSVKSCSISLT